MGAATAAAMSDPDGNGWFRRRCREPGPSARRPTASAERLPPAAAPDQDPVEQTGRALLEAWRRERALRAGPRP